MPQHNPFAARLRTVLLATTGLVVAGCNTVSDHSASADPSENKPVAVSSNVPETTSTDGMTIEKMLRVGDRAWAKNDSATALRLYAMAAKQHPNDPAAFLKIGEVLRKTGRSADAIAVYERIHSFDAMNIAAYHGIGYSQLQMGKPYLASQTFAEALKIDDSNAKSLGGIAVSMDKAGEHKKAQEYYKLAIKADPDNLNYKSNLALSLALSGETEQAIAILSVVTENPKATAEHRQTLALAYGMAGKSGEALKYSRMDLSEKDARNNNMYFEALNSKPDEQVLALDDQIKLMNASKDDIVTEVLTAPEPQLPKDPDVLMARAETEQLSLDASAKKERAPAAKAPKPLVPASDSPMMMAKAEPPATKTAPVKDVAPVVVAKKTAPEAETMEKPAVVASNKPATPLEKPVTFVRKDPAPAEEKPVTFVKKNDTQVDEKPVTFVKKDESAAPAREWTLDRKATTVAPEAPMIADTPADETPKATKIAMRSDDQPMKSNAEAYMPDGGNYFLQIGSYKEKPLAEKGWKIVQTQNVDLLGDIDPVIHEIDLGEEKGGLYYRLKIGGFSDKMKTMQLCSSLRDRSFDCFMASAPKTETPVKKDSLPTLAPNQRMAKDNKDQTPTSDSDTNLIADFEKESFGGAL